MTVICLLLLALCSDSVMSDRTFVIDYPNNQFLKDGQPYRYISGSMHYFRIPNVYWRDRLTKMKAAGLNAISTYVPWNLHEPTQGQYNFNDDANLLQFLNVAQNVGLDVILRPGPYICAEWEAGGFPWWLYKLPNLTTRTSDSRYLHFVYLWFQKLLPMVKPYLYKNGGPIIIMQIENEYGSRSHCDRNYTTFLRELFRSHVGYDFVLITDDGGALSYLKCGYIPGVYPTVDFGINSQKGVADSFAAQRTYAPQGPLVNSEFYPGWMDSWGSATHSTGPTRAILDTMTYMYKMGASFNFYMFEGGTNFGYMNGAFDNRAPITTSYDYDAPLNEAGDPTAKYFAIRDHIQTLTGAKLTMPVPPATEKVSYGNVVVTFVGHVTDLLHILSPSNTRLQSMYPKTFEDIDFPYGFVLYEHLLETNGPGTLTVTGINNRGYIMVDGIYQGRIAISEKDSITIDTYVGGKLQILVENTGRLTTGIPDRKGIQGNVMINGRILTNWLMYPLSIDNIFDHEYLLRQQGIAPKYSAKGFAPAIYLSTFSTNYTADTFFNPINWGKGQLFINRFNLGRYYPSAGPQITLFVPKTVLKNENTLLMLELEAPGNCGNSLNTNCTVSFINYPLLDKSLLFKG